MAKLEEEKISKKTFWISYYKNTRPLTAIRLIVGSMISLGCLIAAIVLVIDPYKRESNLAIIIILSSAFLIFSITSACNIYVLKKYR